MNFISTKNKGFRMEFDNGFAISVQWGTDNYCERRSLNITKFDNEQKQNFVTSGTAEVAIINQPDSFLPIGDHDTVVGWLNPRQVSELIYYTQQATDEKELVTKVKKYLKRENETLYE
tara:strand:+ start:495 stop:848 length:354 start_codon:yes stop_codon:yes gene_type:complete